MRYLSALIVLLCASHGRSQDTLLFANPKLMADYAFRNTDFSDMPSSFLINRCIDLQPGIYEHYLSNDKENVKGVNNLHLLSLLEWWDTGLAFRRDDVLFPVYDRFYMLDGNRPMKVPLFVTDIEAMKVNESQWNSFNSSGSSDPYPALEPSDVALEHVETASIFLDSFGYSNVHIYFSEETFFSNRGRQVTEIILSNGTEALHFSPGSSLEMHGWTGKKQEVDITVIFDDSSSFTKHQTIDMSVPQVPKSLDLGWTSTVERNYYDPATAPGIDNPEIVFATYYACADHKIRKPFLMVAGWGPHTDLGSINGNQNWPSPMWKLVQQYNQEGLIEDLHAQGFDVVVAKFYPPNASILKNCVALEKLIDTINVRKFRNDSYEENIIMGFSAGALATKLTLQMMEKKHLEQNGPHPHTKLFISNDGENQGANVPLGMQHAVKYLMDYEFNNFPLDYGTYALNYILNAPLSKELLHYFHSATGSGENPGQGCDPMRTAYMQYHDWYNHTNNVHVPGYPGFTRNISISNGSGVPSYDPGDFSCDHEPYPDDPGAVFFRQHGSLMGWVNRNFGATFLKHGVHRVFYYEYKQLFKPWKVAYEAKTSNPLVLDNAPGGIIFIEQNPLLTINDELQSELSGAPDIIENYLFSFTPTILTHDVKNAGPYIVNGYPMYNFKTQGLLYDHENTAALGNPQSASDYFGYPHLAFPEQHYAIVPFDALFTWTRNTEHLIGNKKSPDFYSGIETEMKPVLKSFITDEAEGYDIFLQHKRIGYNARWDYIYRVDYEAIHGIYLGQHVTQKTDFASFSSFPNAVVELQAGTEIVFKPGVNLNYGTTFHAFIGDIACEKSSAAGIGNSGDEVTDPDAGLAIAEAKTADRGPMVYPNPNNGSFKVDWKDAENEELYVAVSDLSGKQHFNAKVLAGMEIITELSKGIYIVTIQKRGSCQSKKIIVQ
jgi:hypothetical protein